MTANADMHTSNYKMREGRIGLLRAAPSTPGNERRRRVVSCDYLDQLSLNIEGDTFKRKTRTSASTPLPSSIASVIPNSPNRCEEGLCRINRKQSMKRNSDSVERWSDSISEIGGGTRKHDSMPSFPSRSEKVGLDIDQSPLKLKPCFPPPLNLTKEEISIDAVFIANSRDRSSPRLICDLCQKAGPPVQIDCVDILKGLEHEDLTDFSLDDDDFSDSF